MPTEAADEYGDQKFALMMMAKVCTIGEFLYAHHNDKEFTEKL